MKINAQWHRHVKAWRESGLSQADYCRQQGLNPKTLSAWARRALPEDRDAPLEIIAVQVTPSSSAGIADATVILRLAHGAQLELSSAVPAHWLAELLRCLA
jgi:lambda repressor-like predicted transcriptional regulator